MTSSRFSVVAAVAVGIAAQLLGTAWSHLEEDPCPVQIFDEDPIEYVWTSTGVARAKRSGLDVSEVNDRVTEDELAFYGSKIFDTPSSSYDLRTREGLVTLFLEKDIIRPYDDFVEVRKGPRRQMASSSLLEQESEEEMWAASSLEQKRAKIMLLEQQLRQKGGDAGSGSNAGPGTDRDNHEEEPNHEEEDPDMKEHRNQQKERARQKQAEAEKWRKHWEDVRIANDTNDIKRDQFGSGRECSTKYLQKRKEWLEKKMEAKEACDDWEWNIVEEKLLRENKVLKEEIAKRQKKNPEPKWKF